MTENKTISALSDLVEDSYMDENKPLKSPKQRKSRAGKSIKKAKMDKISAGLKAVLAREMEHLLVLSHAGKLGKDDSISLANYLRLIKDLKKIEDDQDSGNVSVED